VKRKVKVAVFSRKSSVISDCFYEGILLTED
jgi:hypothetical protein